VSFRLMLFLMIFPWIFFVDYILGNKHKVYWKFRLMMAIFFILCVLGMSSRGFLSTDISFIAYLQMFSWLGIGYFSWIFCFTFFVLIFDIFYFIYRKIRKIKEKRKYYKYTYQVISFLALIPFLISFYMALYPGIRKETLFFENLPSSFDGLKIAMISDLHVHQKGWVDQNFVERMLLKLSKEDFDIFTMVGDNIEGRVEDFKQEVESFKKILPPLGKYVVSGNHDSSKSSESWIEFYEDLGFEVLHNRFIALEKNNEKIYIAGVPDAGMRRKVFGPQVEISKTLENLQKEWIILLCHQPREEYVKEASENNVDLMLTGHTHGGQFFPWSYFIYLFQKYAKGFYAIENMTLFVSHGVGFWSVPQRLGSAGEIVILELKSK